MSSQSAERPPRSDWPFGDAVVVVAIVLALGAPALLGFSRTVQTPLMETTPALIAAAVAMSVSAAVFRLVEPRRTSLRTARAGTLGRRLYLFIACLWLLCPIISIVRLTADPSPLGVAAVVVQAAAILGMLDHARRCPEPAAAD